MIILQDSQIKKIFHNGDEVKKILDWDGNVVFVKESAPVMTNTIKFKVGDLNGNTNQTVTVNYDNGSETIPITEGNKWYVHNIPSGKILRRFVGIKEIIDTIISTKLKRGNSQEAFIEYVSGDLRFIGCDTSNVTDMEWMFNNCSSLQTLDLSSFDTSNVTKLIRTFGYCKSLTALDLSNWDTSKVTNMDYMFKGCEKLTSLDVSHFNTSNVTDMHEMFRGCKSLQSLDVSNFNTSNVTDARGMFIECQSLQTLDISGWDLANAETGQTFDYRNMFDGCKRLNTIYMRNCSQTTIDKIKDELEYANISSQVTIIT